MLTWGGDKTEEKPHEEAEEFLKSRDKRYFKYRVQRLKELGEVAGTVRLREVSAVTYDTTEAPAPYLLDHYIDEAQESYVYGNFKSCIFCCSSAVQHVFQHELIKNSNEPEAEWRRFEKERFTLGGYIKEAKKQGLLNSVLDDAKWINRARNTLAAHPPYVQVYRDTNEFKIWKNRMMTKYIGKTLALLNDAERHQILNLKVPSPEGVSTTLCGLLRDPKSKQIQETWYEFASTNTSKILALESFKKMKKIVEGVYPS